MNVLLTLDSMKHRYSGFFSFGKGLGEALLKNTHKCKFSYLVDRRVDYQFDCTRLVNLPATHSFDIVHFTNQYYDPYLLKGNYKRIVTVHDLNPVHEGEHSEFGINCILKELSTILSRCDKVVAISNFVAKDLLAHFPGISDKLSVIYNGVEPLHHTVSHLPQYIPKSKFLFTIGFMSARKGFHKLACLLKDNDYQLIISGIETPFRSMILAEARRYRVEDRLMITGTITDDDRAWYYANCEAFMFASIAEGFGLPVIEAMQFGKPVFLSTYTSLPEVGGDVAYYFNNFESEHMIQVFNDGLQDYHTHNRHNSIVEHAKKFTWQKAAEQYLKLYHQTLN